MVRIVDAETTAKDFNSLQLFLGLDCRIHVEEVGVSEATGLASGAKQALAWGKPGGGFRWQNIPVHGNSDINTLVDANEEFIKVSVGHVEAQVSNKQSLCWLAVADTDVGTVDVLHVHSAPSEDGVVSLINCRRRLLKGVVFDISESK